MIGVDTKIGLALSGGGSRAIAFHLGCMRALQDRGILERVEVLSSVSGGSVIAALYAYSDDDFETFDKNVCNLLRKGFVWGIVRQTLLSPETIKIGATLLTAGVASLFGSIVGALGSVAGAVGLRNKWITKLVGKIRAPLRRRASRTTAFERHLRTKIFGKQTMSDVKRQNLRTMINAAELRTGTAFRYGSEASGCWRYGKLTYSPHVSEAVAASAAFPALLPALDKQQEFDKSGIRSKSRVIIADGGVYDNLGVTPLLPGRSDSFSTNVVDVNFIICCDAGQGMPSGSDLPFFWRSRMLSTISTIHRRTHVLSYNLLHELESSGKIAGFILPYLGQIDRKLPYRPGNLVERDKTFDYPTDFNPMSDDDIELLSKRGEQLTRILLEHYHPNL